MEDRRGGLLRHAGEAGVLEHERLCADVAELDADAGVGAADDGFDDALAELRVADARADGERSCGFGSARAASS